MNWSRAYNTHLLITARNRICRNKCDYHNQRHVDSMYEYYDKNNIPYCVELDVATAY